MCSCFKMRNHVSMYYVYIRCVPSRFWKIAIVFICVYVCTGVLSYAIVFTWICAYASKRENNLECTVTQKTQNMWASNTQWYFHVFMHTHTRLQLFWWCYIVFPWIYAYVCLMYTNSILWSFLFPLLCHRYFNSML